jgi:photosystem II stability/assembly factor-like uncharacterized protein
VERTTDGGATWHTDTVPGAAQLDFRGIAALDDRTAFAMAAGPAEQGQAKIFETIDGGATWTLVYSTDTKGVFLDALSFWDAKHGIAMSDPIDGKLYLLRTDDGGHTWAHIPSDAFPAMLPNEAAFAASGTCLALYGASDAWIATGGGATARVFHSTDHGSTWRVAETPVHSGDAGAAGIFSVAFTDATHGIVVGGDYKKAHEGLDNVALTSDGGATWRLAKGPLPAGYMSAVAYVPGASGRSLVAVGLGGTALSTDGGESWAMVDSVQYNSVAFGAKDAGWTAGPRGRIATWTTGAGRGAPRR